MPWESSYVGSWIGNTMNYSYNILGLLVLIADVYAIVRILESSVPNLEKLLWSLVIILLPVIGLVIWYLVGPGRKPF